MPDINITERPLGSLFSDLTQETASLFRNELRLARAELTNKARQARRGAAEVAVSVVFFLVGLGVLAAAAVLGLAIVVQPWLAAVIVGLLAVGLRSMRANSLAPRRTMGTLRDNTRWAREQLR